MVDTNKAKIKELLERGVEEVIDKDHLQTRLLSGQKLRVKFGIDPTAPDLHLGHLVVLKKLKQFHELGHRVIFLIGDYTGMIGDPSGRSEVRKMLNRDILKKNEKDYVKQAGRILDLKKVEIRHNSEWYDKKGPGFIMELTSKFTFARMIERDDFKKRIENNIDVSLVELLYPLLQGYDSVELKADVELGGNDQKFNLLTGRKVQKRYNQPEQDILTVPLLEGIDGVRKMSKSYGNYIAFNNSAQEMFGKIMSLPDSLLWKYYNLLTDTPLDEISEMKKQVHLARANPRDLKANLAKEVIKIFYSAKDAAGAEYEFRKVFQEKQKPSQMKAIKIRAGKVNLIDLLKKAGIKSRGEARRLIEQGGVKLDDKKITDWKKEIEINNDAVLQIGKRRFFRIKK